MDAQKKNMSDDEGVKFDRVKWATAVAAVLSLVALLGCGFLTQAILTEVQSVWSELDAEMFNFKVKI
uniref:Nematode cuticle collagen N-terminal domain-containing protein n=1 Tax=Romanomermis culicivorax TaxID=13658 RepID=A0A915JWL7_ROMCU